MTADSGRATSPAASRGSRRRVLGVAAALAAAALASASCGRRDAATTGAPSPARRAVLVTIDTLRADRVGAYGAPAGRTPALDALAAAGARFETAISPAPLTLPSHATLLTGLDPPGHGVHHNGVFRLADEVPTVSEALRAQGVATAAFVAAYVLDGRFGLARGFDVYDDDMALAAPTFGAAAMAERPADRVVDAALAWLERAPDRFFLWVHLYDPHAEHRPPEPFASRFGHDPYAGEVAFADAQLGRLLAAVDARWPDGATLVLATSDHGESLGEHGEATHSYSIYDATQRVPLLLVAPGVRPGTAVPGVVRLADVAPTLLEGLGAPPLPGATGTSLLAAASGSGLAPRVAYVETLATELDWRWSPLFGVRTESHKYVRAPTPELYDLRADPGELRNLAEASPALVAELDGLVGELTAGARGAAPTHALDPAERAQLEALGYLGTGPAPDPATPGAPFGTVGGTDPKDELHLVGQLHSANSLMGKGRFEEALALVDRLGERGDHIQGMALRAALGARRLERARELTQGLLERAPSDPETRSLVGLLAENEGKPDAARAAYEEALALGAPSAAPHTGLGRLAEGAGRLEESRRHYEAARASAIPDPEPTWRLAALELEAGQVERGSGLLLGLPQGTLRREDAALRVGRAELAAGRGELARLRVDAALREAPGSEPLLALQGAICEDLGDLPAARRAREEWLRVAPESVLAQNDLAWTLALLGAELPLARSLAERAVASSGGEPTVLDTLAAVLLAQGDAAQALGAVDAALARSEGLVRARLLYRRAEALAGLGRGPEAEAALLRAREEAAGRPELHDDDARAVARLASPRSALAPR